MIVQVTDNERAQAATIEALRQEVTAWSVTAENLEAELESKLDSDLEKIAAERYKVVPAHESMFHRWAVVAGDGTQQLYLGREAECQNMARKFAGAFLDGAYLARQLRREITAWSTTAENLEAERDALREKLADQTKAADHWMGEACKSHNDLVRANEKLAALEAQEPVAWLYEVNGRIKLETQRIDNYWRGEGDSWVKGKPLILAAGAAPVPRMTGAALASQEPVAEVLLVDGEKVIDASMAFFDSVELGTKLFLAAGAAPVPDIAAMVGRFLSWTLPKDFGPDCGISFDGRLDDDWNKNKTWPVGTNLLTAVQAREMFEYVLAAAPKEPT